MSVVEVALASAAVATLAAIITMRQMALNSQSTNQGTVFRLVYGGYTDRRLVSRAYVEIDGEKIEFLRRAQSYALRAYRKDAEEWRRCSVLAAYPSWPNIVAFETAQALEDIGSGVAVGAVPMRLIVPFVADAILDHWLISRDWLDSYRKTQNTVQLNDATIAYHRSNAEWLVLVAALWMRRTHTGDIWREVIRPFGDVHDVEDRVRRLSSRPGQPLPLSVCFDVWRYARVLVP